MYIGIKKSQEKALLSRSSLKAQFFFRNKFEMHTTKASNIPFRKYKKVINKKVLEYSTTMILTFLYCDLKNLSKYSSNHHVKLTSIGFNSNSHFEMSFHRM